MGSVAVRDDTSEQKEWGTEQMGTMGREARGAMQTIKEVECACERSADRSETRREGDLTR
jgi:hypothetical protein